MVDARGGGIRVEMAYYSETARIADGGGEFGVADPVVKVQPMSWVSDAEMVAIACHPERQGLLMRLGNEGYLWNT